MKETLEFCDKILFLTNDVQFLRLLIDKKLNVNHFDVFECLVKVLMLTELLLVVLELLWPQHIWQASDMPI